MATHSELIVNLRSDLDAIRTAKLAVLSRAPVAKYSLQSGLQVEAMTVLDLIQAEKATLDMLRTLEASSSGPSRTYVSFGRPT